MTCGFFLELPDIEIPLLRKRRTGGRWGKEGIGKRPMNVQNSLRPNSNPPCEEIAKELC